MKVLLNGCNGRMGQVITKILSNKRDDIIVCGVDITPDKIINSYPVYQSFGDVTENIDVIIDFSHPSCLDSLLCYATNNKVPIIFCTTGFNENDIQKIFTASKIIPVFRSANMSLGINMIISLVKQAAANLYEDFDIEIIEKHHNQKIDSPSGTALMIADEINSAIDNKAEYIYGRHSKTQKREKGEIGIHAVRGGSIVGDHSIVFAGDGEVIEVNHSAISRDVFAYGAIRASKFIIGKAPGLYTMKDVIESK